MTIISIEKLSRWYGEILGICDLTCHLDYGIVGLVGENGAGKTTLLNCMSGLLHPSEGSISYWDTPFSGQSNLVGKIGFCQQLEPDYSAHTPWSFLEMISMLDGNITRNERYQRIESVLELLHLDHVAHDKIKGFSKGMKQKINLAQAILHKPKILLLDEPLNGLDPVIRAQVIGFMKQYAAEDHLLIVSSHILFEIEELTDQVIMLGEGRLIAYGKIQDIRSTLNRFPIRLSIHTPQARALAQNIIEDSNIVGINMMEQELILETKDAYATCSQIQKIAVENQIQINHMIPSDENLYAIFNYLSEKNYAND